MGEARAWASEHLNIAHCFLGARVEEGLGDAVAVRTEARDYSYAQVHERAQGYASVLTDSGLRPEERVLIALPDGIEMVAAIFGTLMCGSTVVMVNPELSSEAFSSLLEYTRARIAIASGESASELSEPACASPHLLETLLVDDLSFQSALSAGRGSPCFRTHRDDPALWLFSGGTTGRPKAVVQSHGSFANTTACYARHVVGYTPDDVTISVPKLFFGYATGSNLFFPFSVGASCVLFPDRCTPQRLFDAIERFRPTILVNVPTMIRKLLEDPGAASRDLSSLRISTSAGEALPVELYQRWRAIFDTEILDGLGTAEMWHIFLSNHPGEVRPGSLGKPVVGFDVRVRDDEGRDLPAGEVGRLWVRGDSRALCYWQEPEKSRAAFRGEWFVSEDMLRRDADGYFYYCGRGDDMLKVSGKWLAPAELENCLLRHTAVQEATVVGVPDAAGLTRPWAFVVPSDPAAVENLEPALQSFVREQLEAYKAPRRVLVLPDLPRTHLGKVDRGALRRAHAG